MLPFAPAAAEYASMLSTVTIPRYVWRFDADPGVATGDVVVLENVSGGTEEENAIASGELGLEHIGHVVTRLSEGIAGAAGLLYAVPVAFGLGSPPRFSAGSGAWRRTSYAASQEELRATEVKSQLQDRNSFANSSLAVCGQLFLELWSDDSKGFPLPQGCYFTSAQGTERELNIIFAPLNGLATRLQGRGMQIQSV
eukprot:s1092_g3.t1